MTLQQKLTAVKGNPIMFEAYQEELEKSSLRYSRNNMRINGKKVGVNKFINAQKYIAQSIYDKFHNL